MIALFFMAVMGVVLTVGGVVSAMIWFANTAEDECAKRRERYISSQLSTILEKPSANWTIGNAIALTAALDIPIAEMREAIRK